MKEKTGINIEEILFTWMFDLWRVSHKVVIVIWIPNFNSPTWLCDMCRIMHYVESLTVQALYVCAATKWTVRAPLTSSTLFQIPYVSRYRPFPRTVRSFILEGNLFSSVSFFLSLLEFIFFRFLLMATTVVNGRKKRSRDEWKKKEKKVSDLSARASSTGCAVFYLSRPPCCIFTGAINALYQCEYCNGRGVFRDDCKSFVAFGHVGPID